MVGDTADSSRLLYPAAGHRHPHHYHRPLPQVSLCVVIGKLKLHAAKSVCV